MLLLNYCRHQDVHNQVFSMVIAAGRWLGVRIDALSSLFVGLVAVMSVLILQEAGNLCIGHFQLWDNPLKLAS